MSRLRDANPVRGVDISDQALRDLIVSDTPAWRATRPADRGARRRAWVPKLSLVALRSALAASGMIAAALVAVLIFSLTGSAPNVAQAFPALNAAPVLTPIALQQSLRNYGVAGDGGLSVARGHAVATPWGTGYVLTGPGDSFVCAVAPGLSSADWGASCAQTSIATSSGTAPVEYAYVPATHTARFVTLLPRDATATLQTRDGQARALDLTDGLLAINLTAPTQITVTINGHTRTEQISPQDLPKTVPAAAATPGSTGSSTAAASTGP